MTLQGRPRLSFVLPARNEEVYIGQAISSIRRFCPEELLREIILVDHGSTDRTRDLAREAGATVLQPDVRTIAALRNAGAKVATGDVYVFLDADVTLTADWQRALDGTLALLRRDPLTVTGSNCDAPDSPNWFLRYWFKELATQQSPGAIGSAHLIVPRDLFERVGGFDESLQTGEDYAFCSAARSLGARVVPEPSLRTIHHGYPLTVSAFVRRERWHGIGDAASLRAVLGSKVMLMVVAFLVLHLAILVGVFVSGRAAFTASILLLGHLYLSTRVRFRDLHGTAVLKAMAIFYLYYIGRSLSFFHRSDRGAR